MIVFHAECGRRHRLVYKHGDMVIKCEGSEIVIQPGLFGRKVSADTLLSAGRLLKANEKRYVEHCLNDGSARNRVY